MTITAALGRISQIESTFATLNQGVEAGVSTRPGPPASQAGSEQFAAALAQVTGTPSAVPTSSAAGPGASNSTLLDAVAALRPAAAPSPAAPALAGNAAQGEQIVATAKKYLGTPYVWGGETLAEGGLDCSGLVYLVFSEHGIDLPRVARQQMHEGAEVPSLDQAQPGDLIVTRGGAHIGIYVGDGEMLHSPRPGRTVEIRPLREGEITTIRRIV